MYPSTAPTNRLALYSLFAAGLTIFSFCIGFAPIPLSSIPCYPMAVVLSIVALVYGSRALNQIRLTGEKGRGLALLGIWTGIFTILAVVCFTTLTILVMVYGLDYLHVSWPQLQP